MKARITLRLLGALAALALLLWLTGFFWFVRVALQDYPPPPPADGIVALTGGAERIETALQLLAQRRARKMLVSGVGRAADFADMARRAGVDPALADRVTLGHAAISTRGNAEETANWVRDNAIRSLIVVTAGYHMQRALAEFARTLPDVVLYPVAVRPPALRSGPGLAALRLLAGEYTKFLAAEAGLSILVSREADPSGPTLHGLSLHGMAPAGPPERRGG